MNLLLLKVTLMPVVMVLVTSVSRRWGNRVGGLVASLPWIAGPILLFFILEQGKAFGIRSVPGILTGIMALISFCYSYAWLARRASWSVSLLTGYCVYIGVAYGFSAIRLSLPVAYGLAILGVLLSLRYFPFSPPSTTSVRRLTHELLLRAVVATLFVLLITDLASILGPTWSGILTPFPIITSILTVFSHHLQGSSEAIITLRGIVTGLLGFTTFLFLQAYLLAAFPVGVAFSLALLVNVLINIVANRLF